MLNINDAIKLDGRTVARNTMRHIVKEGNPPADGGRMTSSTVLSEYFAIYPTFAGRITTP